MYSKLDGVLPSSFSEPSIMTEPKPRPMAPSQTLTLVPWSWCITIGMCGYISAAAWIRCLMKASPAYLRAPALACRMTGAPVSLAASMTAWTCSRLLTLKAGMP
ncbi:hypothetical protein D3C72_1462450 [compost metagenome]